MSLQIGFLTTLRYNVGDDFIREGIRAIFDHLGVAHVPLYIDKLDPRSAVEPRGDEPVRVDDKYWDADLVVQSGAPLYWHLFDGESTTLTAPWHEWFWVQRALRSDGHHPPLLNLGAGSCFPWNDEGDAFLDDPACAAFARQVGTRAAITTVRDRVASRLLDVLHVNHALLPCPASLAGLRHPRPGKSNDYIALNFMPLGGHWDLQGSFDEDTWRLELMALVAGLRREAPLLFVAHDAAELAFLESFRGGGERVLLLDDWRACLEVYGAARLVVANRVHGAIGAVGTGVPALLLGGDTRALAAELAGVEVLESATVTADRVLDRAAGLLADGRNVRESLLGLRSTTLDAYAQQLSAIALPERSSRRAARPRLALARVEEIESDGFRGWMAAMNTFARRHGLREFTTWSKVWEYPWLWREGLADAVPDGGHWLDLGSERSPLPWWLATRGHTVTLIERDPQWVPLWERLRSQLEVPVDWHLVADEALPLRASSVDIVTSLSVIEHQADKTRAVDEVARVLRPGGRFALSFDICERDAGMTFPAWNGEALDMATFEQIVWCHPAFDGQGAPSWNVADIPAFIAWHRESAPHHNYVVGAAVMRRQRSGRVVHTGAGWHAPEQAAGLEWRWTTGEADLSFWIDAPGRYVLSGHLRSIHGHDELSVRLDGVHLTDAAVSAAFEPWRVNFDCGPGRHAINLRAALPARVTDGDSRRLAFALADVVLMPTGETR